MNIPALLEQTIVAIDSYWNHNDVPWLIGGSCGLLLQGIPIGSMPRDIDIYVDYSNSGILHENLKHFAVDEPAYSKTDRYCSVLSHYKISGVTVELVAGFEVRVPGATYLIDIRDTMVPLATEVHLSGVSVMVMPMAHEFIFNLMRERPDRYLIISNYMRKHLHETIPALREIVRKNQFDEAWIHRLSHLLQIEHKSLL